VDGDDRAQRGLKHVEIEVNITGVESLIGTCQDLAGLDERVL